MFLILSVKSAAEPLSFLFLTGEILINQIKNSTMENVNSKKKLKWKAETHSMKMEGKNAEFFIRTVFGLYFWMYLSYRIYTKNNHKSDYFNYFFRLRQETNTQKDINSSFFLPYCVVVDFDGVTSKTLYFFQHESNIRLKFFIYKRALVDWDLFPLELSLKCKRKPQVSSTKTCNEIGYC